VIRLLFHGPSGSFFEGNVHPTELLQKKLAGSGSTFISGKDIRDLTGWVEEIGHEGFPAGRHHGRTGCFVRTGELIGKFHGLGFGDGGDPDHVAEFSACGGHAVEGGQVKAVQRLDEGLLRVSVVRVYGVTDQAGSVPGCRPAGFRIITVGLYLGDRHRRSTETYAK